MSLRDRACFAGLDAASIASQAACIGKDLDLLAGPSVVSDEESALGLLDRMLPTVPLRLPAIADERVLAGFGCPGG